MDAERTRAFLLKLPLVEETSQWGNNLVYWLGDKAIGGKMFALINLDADGRPVMSFAAGPERFHELVEMDGVVPAPYMARIHWVAMERWGAIPGKGLQELLRVAHQLSYAKMPQRTRETLALPRAELQKAIAVRRALLAARTEKAAAAKAAAASAKQAAKKKAVRKA